MTRQADILLESEGNAWLERNREKLGKTDDPVSDLIALSGIKPVRLLEIGCSNGWRLKRLHAQYGCVIAGIDPSEMAVRESGLHTIVRGTADALPFASNQFDVVICGFFIYYADPQDYLRIAAEADRVLCEGGCLLVYDFVSARPFKARYTYHAEIFSHHFDPSNLWLGHPAYRRISDRYAPRTTECVSLLRKNTEAGFPLEAS